MKNQKQHWDNLHTQGNIHHYSEKPTDFAEEVITVVKPSSEILELGCGVGNDSVVFAKAGHNVLATDFSKVVITKNSEELKNTSNLVFEALDISEPMKFSEGKFDAVYARLSLHYFPDQTTKKVFREIHRILKPGGLLCFMCKSIKDPLYGKGKETEKDMFIHNGHIRHFFSEEYAKECLNSYFKIEKIEGGEEKFYGSESAFIKVIASAVK